MKKRNNSTRFCIDFRALNRITKYDVKPIPDPEQLYVELQNKRFFTKIDLAKGYWQIPMTEKDRENNVSDSTRPFSISENASGHGHSTNVIRKYDEKAQTRGKQSFEFL